MWTKPCGGSPCSPSPSIWSPPTPSGASRRLVTDADAAWITGCERCRSHLLTACTEAGFTPRIAYTTDDYVAVQALVAAGLGVTTLPELALAAHRHPQVHSARLPGPGRRVFAAAYGQPPDPPATAALLGHLAAAASAASAAASARRSRKSAPIKDLSIPAEIKEPG